MNLFWKLLLVFFVSVLVDISCKLDSKTTTAVDPKVKKLNLPPNFHADHLYSSTKKNQGSWVSMTFDNKGRIIASDQYGYLYRIEIPPIGEDSLKSKVKVKKLVIQTGKIQDTDSVNSKKEIGYAQGLQWAFNSLYVVVNNTGNTHFVKSGLYRLQDINKDDQFDKVTLLKSLKSQERPGEHGPHDVVLGPDKKFLYLVAGNRTDLPQMDSYRLPLVGQEDNLFPLLNYPSGGGEVSRRAPAGWIVKTDSSGNKWELIAAGLRNCYDMAFNEAGDLFTFESDKEFDLGMPWYKPTRLYHVISGSEFGWRTGSDIWPSTYPDMVPEILDNGRGSPTALISGKNAKFPEEYQQVLFGFDWSFGIIYAFHLQPKGASYNATAEKFLSGVPLPLTAGAFGPDGALYFLTGGRKLQSDLYRVYYDEEESKKNDIVWNSNKLSEVNEASKIRRQLERYQKSPNPVAVDTAWPYLGNSDRLIRYAARIAIEHQPLSEWQERALTEKDPQTLIQGIIALARHGDRRLEPRILNSLITLRYKQLPEEEQLNLLRAFELVFSRMGKPAPSDRMQVINYLSPHYPAKVADLNRVFSKILIFLQAPHVVDKTLALINKSKGNKPEQKSIDKSSDLIHRNYKYGKALSEMQGNAPPMQQVYLAIALSKAKNGWTSKMREQYFRWFNQAFEFEAARNYIGYINKARKIALENVPKDQYKHYNSISGDTLISSSGNSLSNMPQPKGPGRNWQVKEAFSLVENDLQNRNFEHGKKMFKAAHCNSCHTIRGEGGSVGPDLTHVGNRFSKRDILESIIKPSKEISSQFAATVFILKDGSSKIGRLIREDKEKYYISQNPFKPHDLHPLVKKNVSKTKPSDTSIMPPGLINPLNKNEVKDLIAYILSSGDKNKQILK